jgi:hypothetical protein
MTIALAHVVRACAREYRNGSRDRVYSRSRRSLTDSTACSTIELTTWSIYFLAAPVEPTRAGLEAIRANLCRICVRLRTWRGDALVGPDTTISGA